MRLLDLINRPLQRGYCRKSRIVKFGIYPTPLARYVYRVVVLDDFLTTPIDAVTAHQLLNILAEREPRGSNIVTSQFTPDEWYKSIPDAVIAESILNRLVAGAEIITLEGTNMRLAP